MCPWCLDPQSEVEEGLCRMHEAERLGVTEHQLDREKVSSLLWGLGYGSEC
jgi:hypothetical protein